MLETSVEAQLHALVYLHVNGISLKFSKYETIFCKIIFHNYIIYISIKQ